MKRVVACLGFALAVAACSSTSPALPTAPADTQPSVFVPRGTGPLPIPGTALAPDGRWPCESGDGDLCVEGATITTNDPACFVDWDASGLCKQYRPMLAREDLQLRVAIEVGRAVFAGMSDPDVFLVAPDGRWEYAPDAWPEKHAQPHRDAWTDNPDRRAVVRIATAVHTRPEDAAGLTVAAQCARRCLARVLQLRGGSRA